MTGIVSLVSTVAKIFMHFFFLFSEASSCSHACHVLIIRRKYKVTLYLVDRWKIQQTQALKTKWPKYIPIPFLAESDKSKITMDFPVKNRKDTNKLRIFFFIYHECTEKKELFYAVRIWVIYSIVKISIWNDATF